MPPGCQSRWWCRSTAPAPYPAPQNVACVLNVTQRRYAYMRPAAGFHGRLQNVDVSADTSIDHFTIDKSPRLQAVALAAVLQAAHAESCRPGGTAPMMARPKEAPKQAPREAGVSKEMAPKEMAPKEMPAKSASPLLRRGFEG